MFRLFLSPNCVDLCLPIAHYDGLQVFRYRSIAKAFIPFDENEAKECWTDGEKAEDAYPHLVRYRLAKSEFPAPPGKKMQKGAPPWLDMAGPSVGDLTTMNPGYEWGTHRYVCC
jgi:hypothetical protein